MEEMLNRGEYEAVRCLLGAVNYAAHARDGLRDRIDAVTNGKTRLDVLVDGIRYLTDELIRTVPEGQCRQLKNTMQDMEIRMVPKLSGMTQNVILEKDIAKGLIDAAMDRCHGCVEDSVQCRKCHLYQLLESFLPLESYENGLLCPYSVAEWAE